MITDNSQSNLIKRYSWQREAILGVLRSTGEHPTAEWIHQQIQAVIPNISLGTVYRNLQQLVDAGLIQAHQFGSGKMRYDANQSHHAHFICEHCGRVEDHAPQGMADHITALVKSVPRQINHTDLYLYGVCERCKRNKELE
ncbi:MAG: transcriptional repressor [Lentisphaeria bacterium]|nr:transcriptional repressor [Candidatus Neomarinimicrobiota bacterium]MCF7842855.1 transcriptional repressor [Lentisphaeria bacterium]